MNHFPSSNIPALKETMTSGSTDSKSGELAAEALNVQIFKVLQENKSLRLELQHERQQRAEEHSMITRIAQAISHAEGELAQKGRTVQSVVGIVSNLIKTSCTLQSNVYLQNLGKSIVSTYQNQLKFLRSQIMDHEDDCERGSNDLSNFISYSLFGDPRSGGLEVVPEVTEDEDTGSSGTSESESETVTVCSLDDTTVSPGTGQPEADETSSIVFGDSSTILNILREIVANVADQDGKADHAGSRSGFELDARKRTEVGIQTHEDAEVAKLKLQIDDLKDALYQQSLQLQCANEELVRQQASSGRKTNNDDDLQAMREVVEQQQALLHKLTAEAGRKTCEAVSVSVQAELDCLLFEEILLNNSDSNESLASHDLTISPTVHSNKSSTPNRLAAESSVSDMTNKLRTLFYLK